VPAADLDALSRDDLLVAALADLRRLRTRSPGPA